MENKLLLTCLNLHWIFPYNAMWVYEQCVMLGPIIHQFTGKNSEYKTLEMGCGDGTTSFMVLKGAFNPEFDVYFGTQAEEKNVVNVSKERTETGSLYDKEGDFYNSYSDLWEKKINIENDAEFSYSVGTDWKENLLLKAQHLNIYRETHCFDANITPFLFENESFDFIYTDMIYWLNDISKALNELYRILKPGGKLLIIAPDIGLTKLCLKNNFNLSSYPAIEVLDRGRFENWKRHEKNFQEWETLFNKSKFKISEYKRMWSLYDMLLSETAIRPLLRAFKELYKSDNETRMNFKKIWVEEYYRILSPVSDYVLQNSHDTYYHVFLVSTG